MAQRKPSYPTWSKLKWLALKENSISNVLKTNRPIFNGSDVECKYMKPIKTDLPELFLNICMIGVQFLLGLYIFITSLIWRENYMFPKHNGFFSLIDTYQNIIYCTFDFLQRTFQPHPTPFFFIFFQVLSSLLLTLSISPNLTPILN